MRLGESTPIPDLMAKLRRDKRGYPVPYIVFRDKKGKPQFTVNDQRMVRRCLEHNRCGICGNKLGPIIYFVGGPGSAFHPNGAYIDPPMHKECATYALQVCPFLAYRPYAGAKTTYTLDDDEDPRRIVEDQTLIPGKPSLFVLRGSKGFVNMSTWQRPRLVPTTFEDIEYWKDGQRLDEAEHDQLITKLVEEGLGHVEDASSINSTYTGPMQSSLAVLSTLATNRR